MNPQVNAKGSIVTLPNERWLMVITNVHIRLQALMDNMHRIVMTNAHISFQRLHPLICTLLMSPSKVR